MTVPRFGPTELDRNTCESGSSSGLMLIPWGSSKEEEVRIVGGRFGNAMLLPYFRSVQFDMEFGVTESGQAVLPLCFGPAVLLQLNQHEDLNVDPLDESEDQTIKQSDLGVIVTMNRLGEQSQFGRSCAREHS